MGCDCDIYLPGNVRLEDVKNVLAKLAGKPSTKEPLNGGGFFVQVKGVRCNVSTPTIPEMVSIVIEAPLGEDAQKIRKSGPEDSAFCFYHFECSQHPGMRLIGGRATEFWQAIGTKLVEFFGGFVDYNDCDETDCDFKRPAKSDKMNHPESDKEWESLQNRINQIKPITLAEYKKFSEKSAYFHG